MSIRRSLSTPARATRRPMLAVLAVLATLLVPGLTSWSPADASTHVAKKKQQQGVSVEVLPPIRQSGPAAQRSARALASVVVSVTPAVAGRQVTLEQRRGSRWRVIGTERTRSGGRATFYVPGATTDGATFRASAAPTRGYPRTAGVTVADDWGTPVFVDEFDGQTLGPAWSHRIQFYNPWGGRACSKADPSMAVVRSGVLRLSSAPDPSVYVPCEASGANGQPLGSYPYRLNANISTQHSFDFQYGVAAARMRFPRSMGQHAAFWLQPRGLLDTGPTPWGAEIDVVEYYGSHGRRSVMGSTVYAPLPSGDKRQIGGRIDNPNRFLASRSDRWWSHFHVFSVEWTPAEYVFRIDGREVWRTDQGISDVPEFLILSMLSSDYELPTVGSDRTPRTAEVDWTAVWQAD